MLERRYEEKKNDKWDELLFCPECSKVKNECNGLKMDISVLGKQCHFGVL